MLLGTKICLGLFKKWFKIKCEKHFLEFDTASKENFETENPKDWTEGKYVISDVSLAVSMLFGANVDRMTYYDLVIRKEQTFLRNVYKTEVLAELFLKISFYSTTYTIRQSILIESSKLKLKVFFGITALLRQFWGDFWECWKSSNKIFQ